MVPNAVDLVRVEREFDAPVEILWKIWTDPELLMRWHGGDPEGKGISGSVDLRVGGFREISFRDPDGPVHRFFGHFTIVEPYRRLAFSFEWENEPGHVSFVDAEFIPLEGRTRLIVTHTNLNPTSKHTYATGWNGAMNKIVALIDARGYTPNMII